MIRRSILATIFVLVSVIVVIIAMFVLGNYSVLTIDDFVFMQKDNERAAISIPDTGEKYYNKWQCFTAKNVAVSEAEIDYNGLHLVPLLDVIDGRKALQFNIDPEVHWNKEIVQAKWKALLADQKSVCIFAAYLQTDPDGTTVWYIAKVKTKAGYWDRMSNADKIVD